MYLYARSFVFKHRIIFVLFKTSVSLKKKEMYSLIGMFIMKDTILFMLHFRENIFECIAFLQQQLCLDYIRRGIGPQEKRAAYTNSSSFWFAEKEQKAQLLYDITFRGGS